MTVRCKMRCVEKRDITTSYYQSNSPPKPTCSVKLSAVSDPANATWAKYTPSGTVDLTIDNPDAYNAFVIGEFYFVDFAIAPAKEADETK